MGQPIFRSVFSPNRRQISAHASALFAIAVFALLSTSCVKVSGSLTHLLKAPDFLKSEIITSNTAIANGSDQLPVYIHLMNSDGTPVSQFKPEFAIVSGQTVLPSECFLSDKNGLSICVLKSTIPGSRMFKVTNIKTLDLHKQISFLPVPDRNNQIQIVSGSDQKILAGPYKVRAAIGNITSKPKQVSGHYVLYGSVQGAFAGSP